VFGATSPEGIEANNPALRDKANADFLGIAIHCAQNSPLCNNSHGKNDLLADEPGGYAGYKALFGNIHVQPVISPSGPVKDLDGNVIQTAAGNPGFPNIFNPAATQSLGYAATMLEAGVQVVYVYISDAHDNHSLFRASGPGESDYVAQLQAYDQAFGTFFARLAADGINKSNTLFVFTSDENDHFAGGNSTDGTWSHTFCNVTAGAACPANQIGEVTQNIKALLPADYTPPTFDIHFDSAPTVYVSGKPAPSDANLRQLERNLAVAQSVDPYVSSSPAPVMLFMADPVGQQALHMNNADANRTPSFTYLANPDYFLTTTNARCPDAAHSAPTCVDYHFAWSHGDATEDIGRTWLGMVGPGVQNLGRVSDTWSDHTDIRATMLALLGLRDSYEQDGAALFPFLATSALTSDFRANRDTVVKLRSRYKDISAPFGPFAHDILVASSHAIASGSATDDSHYVSVENSIASLTAQRDALEAQMRTAINNATYGGGPVPSKQAAKDMVTQARQLLAQASALAASS